jgi:hypothetical protein
MVIRVDIIKEFINKNISFLLLLKKYINSKFTTL